MEYLMAAYTDTGTQKEINQDSLCFRRASVPSTGETVMAVVCDGMGGLKKGELASAVCVQEFGVWFDRNLHFFPSLCSGGFSPVRQQWSELLQNIHGRLRWYADAHRTQIGTTFAGLFIHNGRYLIANVGDSRVYGWDKNWRQLTQDHSLVAREVALGHITEAQARCHPQRNVLLQCLGTGDTVSPSFAEGIVSGNMLFLLCSDGFSLSCAELEERRMPFRLDTKPSMTEELIFLTEQCKQRGETDNITSVLVRARESQIVKKPAGGLGLFSKMRRTSQETAPLQAALLETAQIIHTQETI